MSTDAWIEEHWIGEAVLPRPRRAPKLPALSVPHAPTCSRGNAALAAHAQSRDSARHPGDGLSARQDGRNVVDQRARKLTQPFPLLCRPRTGGLQRKPVTPGAYFDGALGEILPYNRVRDAAEPDAGLLDSQSATLQAIQQRWRLAAETAWRWN